MTRLIAIVRLIIAPLAALSMVAPAFAQDDGLHRMLSDFGSMETVREAEEALEAGVAAIIEAGGGTLVISPNAPERLHIENRWQAERRTYEESPVVTIVDLRKGYLVYHVAPIGKHEDGTWAGLTVERTLNLGQQSLPHCGRHANQAINNYVVSGATSYMATLTDPVTAGEDVRCYVDLIRGIWVGQFLNVTSSVMGYAPPYDRIIVKGIGWDAGRRRNYFVADLEYDHPAGALVYNKHIVNGLQVNGYSNCDNQTPGELAVERQNYGVGDSFVISGMFRYMGDVFSGFGDEGGIVLNAETIGDLTSFSSTVEAVDWDDNAITYAAGKVHAHTLSNSRPLINLNEDKWITQGTVKIVETGGEYQGESYPGVIGGPGNSFNYQGGAIIGSAECPWDERIIGRFFCVTDPSEVVLPDDKSSAGGYAKLPQRPARRWYQVRELERNEDGSKRIKILRVRWSAVAAGAPTLFDQNNYSTDERDVPLTYAIAPGAWVYDISEGWGHTHNTGGHLDASHPRKLRVTPNGDRGTAFDFEVGDPVEQAIGADPWQPRPLRIRTFDQIPSTMPSATIEVQQLGRVQVPTAVSLSSFVRTSNDLERRKDKKPAYGTMVDIDALANVGIDFKSEMVDSAIMFRQPNGSKQVMRWRNDVVGSSSLSVEPQTGDFVLTAGNLDLSGKGLERTSGISAGETAAANLRGINVAAPEGQEELTVKFRRQEADGSYAVSVTPSWMTAVCVSDKAADGFTVRFAETPPAGGTVDWVIVR